MSNFESPVESILKPDLHVEEDRLVNPPSLSKVEALDLEMLT